MADGYVPPCFIVLIKQWSASISIDQSGRMHAPEKRSQIVESCGRNFRVLSSTPLNTKSVFGLFSCSEPQSFRCPRRSCSACFNPLDLCIHELVASRCPRAVFPASFLHFIMPSNHKNRLSSLEGSRKRALWLCSVCYIRRELDPRISTFFQFFSPPWLQIISTSTCFRTGFSSFKFPPFNCLLFNYLTVDYLRSS